MLGFTPLSTLPISAFPFETLSTPGLFATGQVGTVSIAVGKAVQLTGVSATGRVGTVTIGSGKSVQLTGVFATGEIGDHVCLELWSTVDTLAC
jgi:hypothetical protein